MQNAVKELEAKGINKIIAVGHAGFDVDKEIAKKVVGVDVVVGGHSNTLLYSGKIYNITVHIYQYWWITRHDRLVEVLCILYLISSIFLQVIHPQMTLAVENILLLSIQTTIRPSVFQLSRHIITPNI